MVCSSRSLFLAALIATLATAACTVLSGVDEMEIRRGVSADAPSEAGADPDAATTGTDAAAAKDATDPPCGTALECQEERCRSDLPDSRIPGQVGKVLGVTATCQGGVPTVIAPGPKHYYGASVRCTLAPQPTAAALGTFVTKMNADGWYGYSTTQEGADVVVVGQSTTRLCNTY